MSDSDLNTLPIVKHREWEVRGCCRGEWDEEEKRVSKGSEVSRQVRK